MRPLEGGHTGPPLQKINYLYERNLVLLGFTQNDATLQAFF